MKFTNVLNLPQFFVRAVELANADRDYEPNTFSVTELLNPPWLAKLNRLHCNEKTDDVSNAIWRMRGTALGKVIEEADPIVRFFYGIIRKFKKNAGSIDNILDEIRQFEQEYLNSGSKVEFEFERYVETKIILNTIDGEQEITVRGALDTFANIEGIVYDLKETKAWSHVYSKNGKKEWHEQTNVYAWLLRKEGIAVNKIEILCLFRDWSRIEALKNASRGYPQTDSHVYELPVWDDTKTEEFVRERIRLHKEAQVVDIPVCSPEERWRQKEIYACTKTGATKSSKNCDSEVEAGEWIGNQKNPGEFYIDFRPGEDTRCLQYCDVNKFCSYYQQIYGVKNYE